MNIDLAALVLEASPDEQRAVKEALSSVPTPAPAPVTRAKTSINASVHMDELLSRAASGDPKSMQVVSDVRESGWVLSPGSSRKGNLGCASALVDLHDKYPAIFVAALKTALRITQGSRKLAVSPFLYALFGLVDQYGVENVNKKLRILNDSVFTATFLKDSNGKPRKTQENFSEGLLHHYNNS